MDSDAERRRKQIIRLCEVIAQGMWEQAWCGTQPELDEIYRLLLDVDDRVFRKNKYDPARSATK